MSAVRGKVAAVTGAGSGIGRALAVELANRGARLAISDVNETGLDETAAAIQATGAQVDAQLLDVSDRDAFARYAESVKQTFGVVHQIYNNAGIGFARPVLETELADYDRVLGINLWGVIYGTKAFLPHLIASGDGHVTNISSLNGYLAQGGMSHYVTAKFGVRGFTESLRIEMLRDRHPVGVTCVHPGGIKTPIADNAMASARQQGLPITEDDERRRRLYNERLLRMPPARAAQIIIDGVEANKGRVLVGRDAKVIEAAVRLMPVLYQRASIALERLVDRAT